MELTLASIFAVLVAGGRRGWDVREFLSFCSSVIFS